MTQQNHRKIWGRRQGRPLKSAQKTLLETTLSSVQLSVSPESQAASLNPHTIFPTAPKLCLEIGFGGGEHLAWRAHQSPEAGFFGCEPFITGVASLLGHMETHQLSNIRIIHDDARLFIRTLTEECLERIYILFPDPWPKTRHHKRRIVHDETIGDLSRILKPGGELVMATDIPEYALWMQEVLEKRPEFTMDMAGRDSLYERPEAWPLTRYEEKGIAAERLGQFLIYKKK